MSARRNSGHCVGARVTASAATPSIRNTPVPERTKDMPDFAERVMHYDTKCRQHLSRVRLSHVLALGALRWEQVRSDQKYEDLIRSSFGNGTQDVFETKLRMVLHELHLVSLK